MKENFQRLMITSMTTLILGMFAVFILFEMYAQYLAVTPCDDSHVEFAGIKFPVVKPEMCSDTFNRELEM